MTRVYQFGNKRVFEPGSYSQINADVTSNIASLPSGNVLIIDTGSAAGYGYGGIASVVNSGVSSIQSFDNLGDFKSFIGGGMWWKYSEFLFKTISGAKGVSNLFFASARSTTSALITLNFDAGNLKIKTPEGLRCNGVIESSVLTAGFAATLTRGSINTAKYVITLYKATYTGVDSENTPWNGVSKADSKPIIVCQSPEIANIAEFIAWSLKDSDFKKYFTIDPTSIVTGAIVIGDLAVITGYVAATGATESYADAELLNTLLDSIADVDFNIIISDQFGANAYSAANVKMFSEIVDRQKHIKFLAVGGGAEKTTFESQSLATARQYNSEQVIVVHGDCRDVDFNNSSIVKTYNSLATTCKVIGRLCGLAPQTPLTFKAISVDSIPHILTEKERKQAVDAGVCHLKFDNDLKRYVINWGLTTLQDNTGIITTQGKSREISIMRIAAQLNREIVVNSKVELLGNQNEGPNRSTLSSQDVKEWVIGFLESKTVTDTVDNLIISYRDVTVTVSQDTYQVNYVIVPNWPVNLLFFTGTIIDK
jgi:vacuolar-type H+-ATPase subunit F/Vma7